jgi:hypothetical protein
MTVLQHLRSRHFDTELHTAWIDENEGVSAFPLWNLSPRRPLASWLRFISYSWLSFYRLLVDIHLESV